VRLLLVTVLFAVLCLHGCDGSIRSCLASEQRKAEQALNLEEAVALQVRLEALSELDELLARHLAGTTAWIEDNPQPIGKPSRPTPPSLRCGEVAFGNERDQCRSEYDLEWDNYKKNRAQFQKALANYQRSMAYLDWQKRAEQESLRLANEIGFLSKSYAEFRAVWNDYFSEVDTIVKPHSQIYQCFQSDDCEANPASYKPVEIYRLSIAEVESAQTLQIREIKRKAKETAQQLCE